MNKTLLLIICDFLLLNLLALTRWEQVEPPRPPPPQATASAQPGESPGPANELVEVMRLSLADEKAAQDQLRTQLDSTATNLQQRETQVAGLQSEKGKLEQDLSATRQTAEQLEQKVNAAAREAEASRIRMAQIQRDLELQEKQAREQKEAMTALEQKHAAARSEIESLNVAVKVAEHDKAQLRTNLEETKQEVAAVREEKLKIQAQAGVLAEGVGKLADKSGELTKEIRDNRPINPNTLFADFAANQFTIESTTRRSGLFGPFTTERSARTVLISDGEHVFALLHISDTPLNLADLPLDYQLVSGVLRRPAIEIAVGEFAFHALDPRVVLVPVDAARAAASGVRVYPLAADPFKFPEAVLVSRKGHYGEIPFKVDPTVPRYVKMDNRFIKWLSGEFTPSTGDLVFSKTGELLGLMVNSDYCLVLNQLKTVSAIRTGENKAGLGTQAALNAARAVLAGLPLNLQ